jgi:NAD(P)-dependent dehydrogenase (short-subunit alcohol dehydrogenase family)
VVNVLETFRLDDVVALVTGAGRGLGAAAAAALSDAGAHVVLAGRSRAALEAEAAAIRSGGGDADVVEIDVSSEESVIAGFENLKMRLGGVDVLVNNAAVAFSAPALETEVADFERVLRTNLIGSFVCARTFARLPARRPDRAVVNVASVVADGIAAGQVAYGASKAGVASVTRTLAWELARYGIRVNALSPGLFATDMPAQVLADPTQRDRLLRRIPLRRAAQPEEIGPPVVFLASSASSYLTGATLDVDGGYAG